MGFFSSTPSEKKQKRKDKFKDEFNVLTKKDYASLNEGDKKKYDFAKENNLIVGQKKKGTTVGNKKFVRVFDPVDYTIISSFNPFEPTKKTLNRKLQNKKNKELQKAKLPFDKKRDFNTDYGRAIGTKPDMSKQTVVIGDTGKSKPLIKFLAERNKKKNKGGFIDYRKGGMVLSTSNSKKKK
mgnify:FL=1